MEVEDTVYHEILDKVPFREKQVATLLNLFNKRNSCSCPSIFVYGHTATGKNFVLETMFEKLQVSLFGGFCGVFLDNLPWPIWRSKLYMGRRGWGGGRVNVQIVLFKQDQKYFFHDIVCRQLVVTASTDVLTALTSNKVNLLCDFMSVQKNVCIYILVMKCFL